MTINKQYMPNLPANGLDWSSMTVSRYLRLHLREIVESDKATIPQKMQAMKMMIKSIEKAQRKPGAGRKKGTGGKVKYQGTSVSPEHISQLVSKLEQ